MFEGIQKLRQHLLTGVSFAIPFIACGGILIAMSIAFAPMTPAGPDFSQSPILKLIADIGSAAFALMLPILGDTSPIPPPGSQVWRRDSSADIWPGR